MIATLGDAWRWYESTRSLTLAMQHLGGRHWNLLPWESDLGRDNRLRELSADAIRLHSQTVLDDLDDLCVLLLFSVFEAVVRNLVLAEVEQHAPTTEYVLIKDALADLREAIEYGSFFRVLKPFKEFDVHLLEEVNQVRRYRNWVAHGRHDEPPESVSPKAARDRLQRFLDVLDNNPRLRSTP